MTSCATELILTTLVGGGSGGTALSIEALALKLKIKTLNKRIKFLIFIPFRPLFK
jgi:hypothetical protein